MRRAVWALLLLSYCGCATSRSSESESHAAVTVQQDTSLARNETRTVTQGPETVTTVVEEFEAPTATPKGTDAVGTPGVNGSGAMASPSTSGVEAGLPPTMPQRAALIKRTTVVDVRGPIVAQTALQATAATETHAEAKAESQAESKRSSRPAGLLALWPLLPVALAVLGYFKRDLLLGLVKRVVG